MAVGPIYLSNAYRPRFTIQHMSTATGATVSSTGLSLTVLISATDGSTTPITANLSATASEVDSGGIYYTVFSAANISTGLASYEDQTVYVGCVGTDIEVWHPALVLDPRRPD